MSANTYWREAATIIAVTRNNITSGYSKNGYKVLFQKRSDKSGFMPSNIVFPGGVSHKSDLDNKWLDFIKSFNIPSEKLMKFQNTATEVPLLFQSDVDPNLRHVALRITAIRETFEEAGLLLCKSRKDQINDENSTCSYQTNFNIPEWQEKVNKNPSEFFSLCEHLDCYPDIFSLYLWSNWLTPTSKPKRFNTAFFITFIDSEPNIHIDQQEVTEYMWATPSEVLESFRKKDLVLATPQWYELSKLTVTNDFDELRKFSKLRSGLGCELMLPIYQKTKDASIATFPGDALYPKTPDLINDNYKLPLKDKTCEELKISSDSLHRMVYKDAHNVTCEVKKYLSKYSELTPVSTHLPSKL